VSGLLGIARADQSSAQDTATPNLQMLKTDLLVVTAHPDDETMMAAAMARYADEGKVVALVSCTHGEGGGNGTGKESGTALGIVRETELRRCLNILGVQHLFFVGQLDWAYTESVQATFAKWGHEESLRRLVRLVRLLRPEVICTMDPAPVGGQHGHHQAAGRLATEAFTAAADPKMFPELQRDEGLAPWRVAKLYWSSFGGQSTVQIATDGVTKGVLAKASPGKRYADLGWEAARQHRSQGFDRFLASLSAGSGNRPPARPNGFLLVKSRLLIHPSQEKDLFFGIEPGIREKGLVKEEDQLQEMLGGQAVAPFTAMIRPRENMLNYRNWLKANKLSHLLNANLTKQHSRVTVVQGRDDNRVEVEITNNAAENKNGVLKIDLPAGWTAKPDELSYSIPPHTTHTLAFQCAVPATAPVRTHSTSLGGLDVVPSLVVARLAASLPVDADPVKWESAGVSPTRIPHTNTVQGRVNGSQECTGHFFVGAHTDGLQVLVEVTDDTVARNIAPDDIKAHWRSTSVEICLDPTPRSENTMSTLKLGIFPQDSSGKIRAARDADARPGELERIHSKIRLASRLTTGGYIVEAHIPWSEAGQLRLKSGEGFGFNVILYHAGKKVARVGEDIGKARLAWSYWPGVPGRPEVWGMAFLP
jgi:LmbE family N-acetylglucosaminyl deacetylase